MCELGLMREKKLIIFEDIEGFKEILTFDFIRNLLFNMDIIRLVNWHLNFIFDLLFNCVWDLDFLVDVVWFWNFDRVWTINWDYKD